MKIFSKLIILSSLFLFSIPNLSSGETCKPSYCPIGVNNLNYVAVQYPFYIKDMQHKSCGSLGFELYCDNTLGTLIQLRDNIVFKVDAINYANKRIILSDPYDCLPTKLTVFDFTSYNLRDTPFYSDGIFKSFWLYKCSGNVNYDKYDRIDCLSQLGASDYITISSSKSISNDFEISTHCDDTWTLTVPIPKSQSSIADVNLSSISGIYLKWDGSLLPQAPKNVERYSMPVVLMIGLVGMLVAVLLALYCCCHRFCRRRNGRQVTTADTNTINNTPTVVAGLDQATIDSYPIVVVGESGRLIKADNNTCPICLSYYLPRETLKMLPECLHRFHSDCIDQWLLYNGICPICRTPPPGNSSHH